MFPSTGANNDFWTWNASGSVSGTNATNTGNVSSGQWFKTDIPCSTSFNFDDIAVRVALARPTSTI